MANQSLTLTQLAYQALRDIGCLRPGQVAGQDTLNDIQTEANQLIDLWLLDELLVYARVAQVFSLIAGQQQYKIGPAGTDFITARPTDIYPANIILNTFSPVVRQPVQIVDDIEWSTIRVQQIPFAIPLKLYYDKNFSTTGYGTINLWPGPLATYQIELYTPQQLTEFADLTTSYIFPPGYARAIRKNLAVSIAPMMRLNNKVYRLAKPVPEMLAQTQKDAKEALDTIRADNTSDTKLRCDQAFLQGGRRSGWNYAIGDYNY